MHIHEHQAQAILKRHGVAVPAGKVAMSPEQAGRAFSDLLLTRGLVKAQIHAGGRGKAGGVLFVASAAQAEAAARKLIGSALVTAQTGPRGRLVQNVLVQERLDFKAEYYLSVTLDRARGCPLLTASSRGGVEVETLARIDPGAVLREYGNPFTGLAPFQARKVAAGLGLPRELMRPMTDLVGALGAAFLAYDCTLIELNPLALTADGRLVAADVKMSFDDNGLARHPDLADLRDPSQEDPREEAARRADLSYVALEGTIGCMVNGAGLAMATMDLMRLKGGEPANFLDVGGNATAEKVAAAFQMLAQDRQVRAILVNIFGGIVRCDLVAQGIIEALKQVPLRAPLVVRLEGTRATEGRQALADAGLALAPAASLDEAAAKAVELANS